MNIDKKIVLAGGTGFLGDVLSSYFLKQGYTVVILSRKKYTNTSQIQYETWDGKNLGNWVNTLEGAEAVINLAGRSVNCRYNASNKQEIYDSRLFSTEVLGKAIQSCQKSPRLWINSSSATIYRHAEDRPMNEKTGEIGVGFSVDVCQKWESIFNQITTPQTRKITLRMAMVLGKKGGVMIPFLRMVRWGLGGTQGTGNQYISWIHEEDFARMIHFLIEDESIEGVINCSAPNPVPNRLFLEQLRKQCKIPYGLPSTKWMVEIGAWLIGTEAELLLKSRRVIPQKIQEVGFQFLYPTIQQAFEDLVIPS